MARDARGIHRHRARGGARAVVIKGDSRASGANQPAISGGRRAAGKERKSWRPCLAGEWIDDQGGTVSVAAAGSADRRERRAVSAGVLALPEVQRGVLQADYGRAVGYQGRERVRRTEWQKTRDRNEAIDARSYARAAAAVYGMDRFNDGIWSGLEDRVEEMSKRVGQPQQPAAPAGPPQRTIRGRLLTNDPPPRRW